MAPFIPSLPGVSTTLAPSMASKRPPFHRHGIGHGQNQLVSLGRRHEGQGDAGVAAGRLDDDGVLLEHAPPFGVLDHGHADAVLDAAQRIEKLALEQDGGLHARRDSIEADQGRAADGFDDTVKNACHEKKGVPLNRTGNILPQSRPRARIFFIPINGRDCANGPPPLHSQPCCPSRPNAIIAASRGAVTMNSNAALPQRAVPWVAALRARKFAPFIGEGDIVLEYGAGSGWNLAALRCRRKIGYDVADFLEPSLRALGIEFAADTRLLPEALADVVICHHTLEHLLRPPDALEEMRRLLKPAPAAALCPFGARGAIPAFSSRRTQPSSLFLERADPGQSGAGGRLHGFAGGHW